MAARSGPRISKDKMILCLDAANIKSFDTDLIENKVAPTTWTFASVPSYTNNPGYCMAYGDSKFVWLDAGGNSLGGSVSAGQYSTDGSSWTNVTNATSSPVHDGDWKDMIYSSTAERFVAVADTGDVMYSVDGLSWTAASAPSNYWTGVTYGDSKFVAVSKDGTNRVIYDDNGSGTWTQASAAEANDWQSVSYGNGRFVAVSWTGTNRLMHSTNGSSWSTSGVSGWNNTKNWTNVKYFDGKFIAIAASNSGNSSLLYSTDGLSWSNDGVTGVNNVYYRDLAYGNGYWVASSDVGSDDKRIMYSKNGLNWTVVDVTGLTSVNRYSYTIDYGNKIFVAGYATDGSDTSTTTKIMWSTTEGVTYPTWKDILSDGTPNGTVGISTISGDWDKFTSNNGGVIIFNGTSDKVTFPTSSIVLEEEDFTIGFWVYTDDVSTAFRALISSVNNTSGGVNDAASWQLGLGPGSSPDKIRFTVRDDDGVGQKHILSNSTLSIGTWYYIVLTRTTGGNYKIYINGELDVSDTDNDGGTDLDCTTVALGISRGYNNYWDGGIAMTQIYKGKALSATEVKQNFNAHKSRFGL